MVKVVVIDPRVAREVELSNILRNGKRKVESDGREEEMEWMVALHENSAWNPKVFWNLECRSI